MEKVIIEKEAEIRRLKALWSPTEECTGESLDGLGPLDEVPHATKVLNAPELGKGKAHARYGISAENRISVSTALVKVVSFSKRNACGQGCGYQCSCFYTLLLCILFFCIYYSCIFISYHERAIKRL